MLINNAGNLLFSVGDTRTRPDDIFGMYNLNIHRRDRLGGVLHEYKHAA